MLGIGYFLCVPGGMLRQKIAENLSAIKLRPICQFAGQMPNFANISFAEPTAASKEISFA